MAKVSKKKVRRALVHAKDILERNANSSDTFEGVLSRGYVRALRTLVVLGETFLARRMSAPRPVS